MIGKLIAVLFIMVLFAGLGIHGTVSALHNGYTNISSNPLVQHIKSDAINMTKQEIKNEFSNSTAWSNFGAGFK